MFKALKKILYYCSILPPIINTIKEYIQSTQELAKQLKILNTQISMEEQFEEDNSDD